jgi:hypothetical protein
MAPVALASKMAADVIFIANFIFFVSWLVESPSRCRLQVFAGNPKRACPRGTRFLSPK